MTSKHYKWQGNWIVDRAARTTTHNSGLVYDWAPGQVGQGIIWALPCNDVDALSTAWAGQVSGGDAALQAWLLLQPALRDPASRRKRIMRLGREASEMFAEALRDAAPKRGGARVGAGRPAVGSPVQVRLTDAQRAAAGRLGDGNLNAGVRAALDLAIESGR